MRILIRFGFIALGSLFAVHGAFAQAPLKDFPPGKWWTNKRVIQELKLSPEQQTKIETLWTQSRKTLIDQKAELEKRQLDLSELLARDTIDEAAALKVFEEVQQARLGLERSTFLMRIQIKNLLAPEQQQKIETIAERLRQQKARSNEPPPPARPAQKK
jgi:Spy/CpxP family protein refolding chaperone